MYRSYKSFIVLIIISLFSLSVVAEPLTILRIKDGEVGQYAVGEIIIIDNDNQRESYTIDSINNNDVQISKRYQNGVEMNVINGSMNAYPVPWQSEFDQEFILLDSINYLSPYPVGSSQYIADIENQLELASNNWPEMFQMNYFFEGAVLRADTYFINGVAGIPQYIKIYYLVNGSYISTYSGLTLNVDSNYADVDIGINQILILAFVVVVALASIFIVRKSMKLANKT